MEKNCYASRIMQGREDKSRESPTSQTSSPEIDKLLPEIRVVVQELIYLSGLK
jgi:hypothetical protein